MLPQTQKGKGVGILQKKLPKDNEIIPKDNNNVNKEN
jgi:hypothetical protein